MTIRHEKEWLLFRALDERPCHMFVGGLYTFQTSDFWCCDKSAETLLQGIFLNNDFTQVAQMLQNQSEKKTKKTKLR